MSERWQTPPTIFEPLMNEFDFDLDAAADFEITRLPNFLTNALEVEDWPGKSTLLTAA